MARYIDVEPIEKFLAKVDTENLDVEELKNLIRVISILIETLP